MKTCKKCNTLKPLTEYYKHSQMADGHLNVCKDCKKAQQTQTRNDNIDYYRAYDSERDKTPERMEKKKAYYQTEAGKQVKAKANKKYKHNFPKASKARNAVSNAIRDGKLIKPTTCECCGNETSTRLLHGHHCDYDKPLDVMWLCNKCHVEWHMHNTPINIG